jgi:hypothetical protein
VYPGGGGLMGLLDVPERLRIVHEGRVSHTAS